MELWWKYSSFMMRNQNFKELLKKYVSLLLAASPRELGSNDVLSVFNCVNLFTWKLCWGSPGGNLNEFRLRGEMWEQYNGKQAGPATVTVTHSHCVTQPGSADYVSVVHLFHICPAPVNGSLFRVINCFLILWSSDPLQLNLITCCLASCGREEGGGASVTQLALKCLPRPGSRSPH